MLKLLDFGLGELAHVGVVGLVQQFARAVEFLELALIVAVGVDNVLQAGPLLGVFDDLLVILGHLRVGQQAFQFFIARLDGREFV